MAFRLRRSIRAEVDRLDLEEIRTEINKMIAQTDKIYREARYYPIIANVAFITSLYVAFKVLHR
jgi:hypothetical protein